MIITNDTLTFEQTDIDLFSVELQNALTSFARKIAPDVFLSRHVNEILSRAKAQRVTAKILAVKAGAAKATSVEKAQVDALITQAEEILKISLTEPPASDKLPTL